MSATERRAAPRTAVVWDVLDPVLGSAAAPDGPLEVLDIGGGTGGSAVRIAADGHRVSVVDPSPDALAALARRAGELGVEVSGRQGDVTDLAALYPEAGFDLVLCHGVLEVVDDPATALAAIRRVLRPGGALSLLVAQRHAAVVARAMAGHFAHARALLDDPAPVGTSAGPSGSSRAGRRFTADEAGDLLVTAGFVVEQVHAVRVFADLVPGSLLDLEPGAPAALVELERAVAARPEYLPLASQVHLLAR